MSSAFCVCYVPCMSGNPVCVLRFVLVQGFLCVFCAQCTVFTLCDHVVVLCSDIPLLISFLEGVVHVAYSLGFGSVLQEV